MRWMLDRIGFLRLLAVLAVLVAVDMMEPGWISAEDLAFYSEVTDILIVLTVVDWAFIPVLNIDKLIVRAIESGSKTMQAACIVGWFIFLGLLGYGLTMLHYT